MPASLVLYSSRNELLNTLTLGEIQSGTDFSHGEPRQVRVVNAGDTNMREIAVHLEGEGAQFVQLAVDDDGGPGAWAEEGQGIMAHEGTLFPQNEFTFWARGIFSIEDREGDYPVEFVLQGVSIG